MIRYPFRHPDLFGVFCAVFIVACSGHDRSKETEAYLIRVGQQVLTARDFHGALEIAKAVYPYETTQDPVFVREMQQRVLNQLIDELVIMERAGELNISLSQAELDTAVNEIKSDYPGDVFEQTLLESAISYGDWVNRIKVRLIMERVIENDLAQRVDITPKDVLVYLDSQLQHPNGDLSGEKAETIEEKSVIYLRRNKAEKDYNRWIEELKKVHQPQINRKLWRRITGA